MPNPSRKTSTTSQNNNAIGAFIVSGLLLAMHIFFNMQSQWLTHTAGMLALISPLFFLFDLGMIAAWFYFSRRILKKYGWPSPGLALTIGLIVGIIASSWISSFLHDYIIQFTFEIIFLPLLLASKRFVY